MRQRVMIAMALCCKPDILICDEPTTALDVTIQAQIISLIEGLKVRTGTAVIMITHDLGVISEIADKVIVMYAGKIVEEGSKMDVLINPMHPYTEGLLNAVPRIDKDSEELNVIPGMVPTSTSLPKGCYFRPRCRYAREICVNPPAKTTEGGEFMPHGVSCWKYQAAWGDKTNA
jgi:peptide/nickel transport system ATP-binding protein/oligopeptide transport system ATP-binding protein